MTIYIRQCGNCKSILKQKWEVCPHCEKGRVNEIDFPVESINQQREVKTATQARFEEARLADKQEISKRIEEVNWLSYTVARDECYLCGLSYQLCPHGKKDIQAFEVLLRATIREEIHAAFGNASPFTSDKETIPPNIDNLEGNTHEIINQRVIDRIAEACLKLEDHGYKGSIHTNFLWRGKEYQAEIFVR